MANVKISDLVAAASLSSADLLEIEQSGPASKKMTLSQLRAFLGIPTPPVLADFTSQTRGSGAISQGTDGITFNVPAVTSGDAWNYIYKAAPSMPYTVSARFAAKLRALNITGWGVMIMDASTGKFVTCENTFVSASGHGIETNLWTNTATFGSTVLRTGNLEMVVEHLRCVVDTTNVTTYLSPDGINWFQHSQTSRATNAGSADRIGFGVKTTTSGGQIWGVLKGFSVS